MLAVDIGLSLPGITMQLKLALDDEILVLFGPSGAGKSLTIKMIAGLVTPDHGRIAVDGRSLYDSNESVDLPPQRRNIGYVPQRSGIFPHLTAVENIALPLRRGVQRLSKSEAEGRALDLLQRFGLERRAGSYPAQLSGGELQRVALARVMALQPDVLLVDEPFAALDGPVRNELRREFRAFQRELSIPTIFITHDIEEAAVVGDRIAILVDGALRQAGTAREILDAPVDREVAALVQSENLFDGTVVAEGDELAIDTAIGALKILPGEVTAGSRATAVIRPEGIRILREDRGTARLSDATILEATIEEIADHGSVTMLRAAVAQDQIVVTLSPTAAANLELHIGKPIRLAIPPERVHLILDRETRFRND